MAEGDEVRIQFYIEDQGKSGDGDVFSVRQQRDIDDLKRAVYRAGEKSLGHCDAFQLEIFQAGTESPSKEEDKLRSWEPVPKGTTGKNPLRVVAPAIGKNVSFFCPRTLTVIPRMQ
jgi:hypothetical protein